MTSDQITRGTFAGYALVCVVAGLMIGYGCAWLFSSPVAHIGTGTDMFGAETPVVVIEPMSQELGLVLLGIMLVTGIALAASVRYIVPWLVAEWTDQGEE